MFRPPMYDRDLLKEEKKKETTGPAASFIRPITRAHVQAGRVQRTATQVRSDAAESSSSSTRARFYAQRRSGQAVVTGVILPPLGVV